MIARRLPLMLCLPVVLAGCAGGFAPFGNPAEVVEEAGTAETAALETEAETAEAAAAGGQTVATLGNPGEPGLWLRTTLVQARGPGTITAEGGRSVAVTLIPIPGDPGAGSQISLAAMQALGQPLTALVPLTVLPG